MTDAGLNFKSPGGKEALVAGGAALGLALLYFFLTRNKKSTSATQTATAAPGSSDQSFLPGGASPTGNAFTDAPLTSPVSSIISADGAPIMQSFALPVRHVQQGAASVLGSGGGGVSGGAPSGGSITSLSGTSPLQWATAVLVAGGFPKTAANLQSLVAWALNEGGGGANNPLNTTQGGPGATNFNSIGVKNFPTVGGGVQATVATINNGNYPNILADLRSGRGIGGNAAADLSKWSGGGYSSLSGNWARAAGLIIPPPAKPSAAVKAATPPQIQLPTVPPNNLVASVTNAFNSIANLFRKPAARPASPGVKAATPAQIRNLFPKVTPGWRVVTGRPPARPARRPAPRPPVFRWPVGR